MLAGKSSEKGREGEGRGQSVRPERQSEGPEAAPDAPRGLPGRRPVSRRSRARWLPASQERTHSHLQVPHEGLPPGVLSPGGRGALSPRAPGPPAPASQEAPPAEGRGGLSVPRSPPWSPLQPEPVPLQSSLSAWPRGLPRRQASAPVRVGCAACDLELLVADELGEPAGRLPRPEPRAAAPAADPVPAGLGHGPHERLGARCPGRRRRLQIR